MHKAGQWQMIAAAQPQPRNALADYNLNHNATAAMIIGAVHYHFGAEFCCRVIQQPPQVLKFRELITQYADCGRCCRTILRP